MLFEARKDARLMGYPEAAPELHPKLVLGTEPGGSEVLLDLPKLHAGRLLIQAPSGAGKSTLLRQLVCEVNRVAGWIVIDPEGEHLKTLPGMQPRDARYASDSARMLRERGPHAVVDLSEMKRENQLIYLDRFIHGLLEVPEQLWTQRCVVILDECEVFTPSDTSAFDDPKVGKRSRMALIDLMSRGRKRGLIGVLATHRLPQLAASVRAEARNFLIGGSSFDVDIMRAADVLGWTKKHAFEIIPKLPVGSFLAVGDAFNVSPTIVRIPAP